MATYFPSQKPSKLDEQNMQDTAGEIGKMFSYGPLHTGQVDDQLKLIYNSSVRTQDVD